MRHMPKLPTITPKKLLKILHKHDFIVDHTTGSHYILYRASDKRRVVVSYHGKDIPKGTLHAILKSADINRDEL